MRINHLSPFCLFATRKSTRKLPDTAYFHIPSPLVRLSAQTCTSYVDFHIKMMILATACAEITQNSHKRCPALRVPCHVERARWVETSVCACRKTDKSLLPETSGHANVLYKAYSYGLRSLRKYHNTLKAHEYALQVVYYVFVCPKVSVENENRTVRRRKV